MSRSLRSRTVAAGAALALGVSLAASAVTGGSADASGVVKFVSNPSGSSLKVSATTLHTGVLKMSVVAPAPDNGGTVEIVSLKPGYSLKDLRMFRKAAGGAVANRRLALKLINKGYQNVTFIGGVGSPPGMAATAAVVLPNSGTYYAIADNGNALGKIVTLHVTGPVARPAVPHSRTIVEAVTNMRWGGPATIPGTGTLVFRNKAKDYPHFVDMFPVKAGTTKDDVLAGLQSNSPGLPSFFDVSRASSTLGLAPVRPGGWESTPVHLAPGAYALLCFMPDKKTGMPHAFMGMIKIVTVS